MKGAIATVAVLLGLLAGAVLVTFWAWEEMGEVEMSGHGLMALGLGIGASLIVGVGLMTLIFFSHRRGYDDQAHRPDRQGRGDRES